MCANADDLTVTHFVWDTVESEWEEDGETGVDEDILLGSLRVSDNGLWAVGSCGDYPYVSYLVDIEDDCNLIYLNDIRGVRADKSRCNDVSDNGIIVGSFINSSNCWVPGWRTVDSEWVELPAPEKCVTDISYYEDWSNACNVKRVSPDGHVLLGQFPCYDTAYYEDGSSLYFYFWEPCLWIVDDDMNVLELKEFYGLEYYGQGFIPWDMTDDGSIIVGMRETVRGDQCPGLLRNDKLEFVKSPVLIAEEDYESVYYEEGHEDGGAFWIGRCSVIDAENNVYYYYKNGDAYLYGCRWNMDTDERVEYQGHHVSSAIPGLMIGMQSTSYGPAMVLDYDDSKLLVSGEVISGLVSAIDSPSSISDNGRVIAGADVVYSTAGYAENVPALLVFSEPLYDPEAEAEEEAESEDEDGIQLPGTSCELRGGDYYNLSGVKVVLPTKGIVIQNGKKVVK